MKKTWILSMLVALLLLGGMVTIFVVGLKDVVNPLPAPELSEGARGEMGIDKNINESTLDGYLGRDDTVYRDMRMLNDPADYESIGGDSYLSGFVKGFEVVPYPMLVNVEGLPPAVGESYNGTTLFTYANNEYKANYDESLAFLEYYFPKDKNIFLMCGGGGYAGMTKNMLVALGWDANKIYDVGGYWYYYGENNVEVKRETSAGVVYDFWKVTYHAPDFATFSKPVQAVKMDSNMYGDGNMKEINANEFNELVKSGKNFLVMAHMEVCPAELPLTDMTKQLVQKTKITVYTLNQDEFKKTELTNKIKYLPTMAAYQGGKLVGYLDAESDADLGYYQSVNGLESWVKKYVEI